MELRLDDAELAAVDELADAIGRDYGRPDHPELLVEAPALACRLPGRIPHFLNRFRRTEAGHCLIRGHHVDQDRLGPTPGHWKNAEDPQRTLRFDVRLVLYSAVLGDVFGWATQQDGRIINDVLPIKGNETKQLGSASDVYMHFHTEDPFHEHRPDFVTLACLRNPDRTATTMGHIDDVAIDPRDAEVLFEPRFVITPDEAHLSSNNTLPHNAFAGIEELLHRPPPVAVLYGDRRTPYLRADAYYWRPADPADRAAAAALARLAAGLTGALRDVTLAAGDYCFLNNHKVVHGRRPFRARYDGTDRWLKRVCIARDLRRSREARSSVLSQVMT